MKSDKIELNKISILQNKAHKQKNEIEVESMKLSSQLKQIKLEIRDSSRDKDEYLNKIQKYELASANIKNEIKSHKQRIQDVYSEDLSEGIFMDDCDIDELINIISKHQMQINKIGPINMAVSDEYEKELARYDFLCNQFDLKY